MGTFTKIFKGANLRADTIVAIAAIVVLGLLSNYLTASRVATDAPNVPERQVFADRQGRPQPAPHSRGASPSAQSEASPVFTAGLMLETPDRRRIIPGKAILEKIEVVMADQVPDNEGLGSYGNSSGGIGNLILKNGGKAYKMTFTYINEGKYSVKYESRWLLHGDELESIINSYGDRRFAYAYGQVPVWTKISNDPVFYESNILKSGQRVTETVWFFPCPPVKRCLISDFEMREPIEIVLP